MGTKVLVEPAVSSQGTLYAANGGTSFLQNVSMYILNNMTSTSQKTTKYIHPALVSHPVVFMKKWV